MHLSDKAVDPPGQARADLDIFLDYARRMDFRDKDGNTLPPWHDPESAFEAWKRCSEGRPCDYTGLSYERLRGGSGIQWPCNAEHPDGTERLYVDGQFWSKPSYCEGYGKDLATGASVEAVEYRALNPDGKAVLKAAGYTPPHERPDGPDELWLITGRTVYQFHTRTKTARAPQLNRAAPDVWVEMSAGDAAQRKIREGEVVEIRSARGSVQARVRITGIADGVAFMPFHYGYWDTDSDKAGHRRAANELTITDWDPVSKQPIFKTSTVRIAKLAAGDLAVTAAPSSTSSKPLVANGLAATNGEPDANADERLVTSEQAR